jgi:hypothetical protein
MSARFVFTEAAETQLLQILEYLRMRDSETAAVSRA